LAQPAAIAFVGELQVAAMLDKHPDLMSDDQLREWVTHLVDDQVEEGPRLDYKEIQTLDQPNDRREVAKDVSSFANELGGTILYGVPEDRTADGRPIPKKPYGINQIKGFESRVENILVDAIGPALPQWRIRMVTVPSPSKKVVYVVWTPESWVGVHMVEAYGDRRYYRRGQYRAVEMTEEEVRGRYERLRAGRGWLESFLESPELNYVGSRLPDNFTSHYVVCPVYPLNVEFASDRMYEWLHSHPYPPFGFSASPYGARTRLEIDHARQEWEPYVELYRNGAVSLWRTAAISEQPDSPTKALAYIAELRHLLEMLQFGGQFYSFLGYSGPIRTVVTIFHRLQLMSEVRLPTERHYESRWPSLMTHDNALRMTADDSAMTLIGEPRRVLKRLADEMFKSYGLWEAHCFDENLNLMTQ